MAIAIAERVDHPREPHLHTADREARQNMQQGRGRRRTSRKRRRARFQGRRFDHHEQEIALKRLRNRYRGARFAVRITEKKSAADPHRDAAASCPPTVKNACQEAKEKTHERLALLSHASQEPGHFPKTKFYQRLGEMAAALGRPIVKSADAS